MNVEEFITSQWFQEQAQCRIESESDLSRTELLHSGDIIYCRGWNRWFTRFHDRIQRPYVLLSNFHDRPIAHVPEEINDPKMLHWFGVNMAAVHPKMTPIPLAINADRLRYIKHSDLKLGMYLNCTNNNPERTQLYRMASTNGWHAEIHNKHNQSDYFWALACNEFVLCPKGNGQDTYRVWETLASGSTPIVKTSFLDRLYQEYPIAIVNEWTDVPSRPNRTLDKLTKSYWREQLNRWKN